MRRFRVDVLHLATLTAFAVAQPLLDLLGRKPEFFAVRRSEPIDLLFLAAALILIVPLPLIGIEALARQVHSRLARWVHGILCAALIAAIVLPPLHRSLHAGPWWALGGAAMLGVVGAVALDRLRPARLLLAYLAPAMLVFPAAFLLRPGISKVLRAHEIETIAPTTAITPIVVVIFDELPLVSLLANPSEIDAVRYPNFAGLAAESTWYRRAATVSDFTVFAVPAILSGQLPGGQRLPITPDYPHNLFTLLGESYVMNVSEPMTQLCPASLCSKNRSNETLGDRVKSLLDDLWLLYLHVLLPPGWTAHLPPVDQNWMLFAGRSDWRDDWKRRARGDRAAQVTRFLEGILPTEEPVLHLLHVLLPHPPFDYLPSGQLYSQAGRVIGDQQGLLRDDEWAAEQNHQRHLLQLGYVDRVLGDVVDQLREKDLWNRAVVVVTADHGTAFQAKRRRRRIDHRNFAEILAVPLWIKAPGQSTGRLDERGMSTVDILPTIADLAGIEIPWPVDGMSLADPATPGRDHLTVVPYRTPRVEPVEVSFADLRAAEGQALSLLNQRFGLNKGGGRELFRIGPERDLFGRAATDLPMGEPVMFRHRLHLPYDALYVTPGSSSVPAHLLGDLVDGSPARPVDLAVAVNGRIAAVTRSWKFDPDRWSAIVDPDTFRAGNNHVEVFELTRQTEATPEHAGHLSLRPIPAADPVPIAGLDERGLHAIEQWKSGVIRWTDGDAAVTFPIRGSVTPRKLKLTVADNGPGGKLRVIANGARLLDTRLEPLREESWSTTLELSDVTIGDRLTVVIESDSFVPSRRYKSSADTRRLGVAIAGFELLD